MPTRSVYTALNGLVLKDLGVLLHVPAAMALLSIPVCLAWGEAYAVPAFLWTASVPLALGQLLFWSFRRQAEETYLGQAMFVAALGWILVPLAGALPFVQVADAAVALGDAAPTVVTFTEPWNALFEAFSGFTGTGLTVADRPSRLPHCLQWWRSFTEWVGGVGVIVLMLSILRPRVGISYLYSSEARTEKIFPTVSHTVRTIWWIYLLYTAGAVLALGLAGMPWWEALNHGMTGISTGGFTVTDDSFAGYSPLLKSLGLLILVLGAVSFSAHYALLGERRISALWGDSQHRLLWASIPVGAALLAAENAWRFPEIELIDSLFQWVSASTTGGFQSAAPGQWSPTAMLLLTLAMMIGGTAGSTAGGLKLVRMCTLYKGLVWRVRRINRSPHQVLRYQMDGEPLSEDDAYQRVEGAGILTVLWPAVMSVVIVVLLHVDLRGHGLEDVIFEAASAQSNVGLSSGVTHPALPWPGKLALILSMWIGRLEIIPVIILLASLAGNRRSHVSPTRTPKRGS